MGALMSLGDLLSVYRARLRDRTLLMQELFAVLGIAVGVGLLFASQVASSSLAHSASQLTEQVAGKGLTLQMQARGSNDLSEEVLHQVSRLPAVEKTLPVLEAQVSVIGPRGRRSVDLIGTDPHFAAAGGPLLRRFRAVQLATQQAIALPDPLASAIGDGALEAIHVQVGSHVWPVLLAATLGAADIGGLVDSPVALTNVRFAQRLAGLSGRITRIFVRPWHGRDAVARRELTHLAQSVGANVEPATYDATLFAVASAPARLAEGLFSAISALVAFLFALNAMLVAAPSRRSLIEDVLRPQGATRAMSLQILLFDAAVLAFLGCTLGLLLGNELSIIAFNSSPNYLSFAFPVGNVRVVTWLSVALALGAGVVATIAGALWPFRDLLGGRWRGSERASARPRVAWPSWLGLGLVGSTTLMLALAPRQAVLASVTLVLALLCLLPWLFDGLVTLFDWLQRRMLNGAPSELAVIALRSSRSRVRSLAIVATAAIALFGIVQFQGAQANLQRGLDNSAREIDANADVWVTPAGGANTFATTPFTPSLGALANLPGVRAVGLYRGSFLNWGKRRVWVLAPPAQARHPTPPNQLVSGQLGLATARLRRSGWAVLSQELASEQHLRIGARFTLPSPRPTVLRVAALSTNLAWPSGAVVMNSDDYARAWGSRDASAYQVLAAGGTSLGALRREIERTLGPGSGLVAETTAQRERRHFHSSREGLSRLTQIRTLLLIAAVLAVAGAIAAMIWQRRDLVAVLKCDGYSRGVVWRWLCCESALLVVGGSAVGAAFGLYGQLVATHYLATVTGFPVVYDVAALPALVSLSLLSAVAIVVLAVPGYVVAKTPARAPSPAY